MGAALERNGISTARTTWVMGKDWEMIDPKGKANLFSRIFDLVDNITIRNVGEPARLPSGVVILKTFTHALWAIVKGVTKGLMDAAHGIAASHEDLKSKTKSATAAQVLAMGQ